MRILCPKAFASTLPCLGGCGFLDALSTFSYISFSWIFGGDCCALKGSRVGRILGRWRDGDTWSPCSNELWNVTEACFDMQQYHANQGYVASHLHFARLWLFLFLPQWLAWLLEVGKTCLMAMLFVDMWVAIPMGIFISFLEGCQWSQAGSFRNLFWDIAGGWPNEMATTTIKKRS